MRRVPQHRLQGALFSLHNLGSHLGFVNDFHLHTEPFKTLDKKQLVALLRQDAQTAQVARKAKMALEDARRLGHSAHEGLEEHHHAAQTMHEVVHQRLLEYSKRLLRKILARYGH